MTYAEHRIQWEAEKQSAIAGASCFCRCGCRNPNAPTTDLLGIVLPGLCPTCKDAAKTKAGRKTHSVMRREHENYVDPEDVVERPKRTIRGFVRGFVADVGREVRRNEAEAYVREVGREGLRVVSDLYDKVVAGERLTDVQVENVLRSKAADIRSAKAADKRLVRAERGWMRKVDLNRIFIDEEVADGSYALETKQGIVVLTVERPKQGPVRGFVVIKSSVGGVVEKWGVQYPQPHRVENPDHRQFYRGHYAHLVAELVGNPEAARERFKQMEEAA